MTLDEAIAILSDMKIDIPVPKAAVTQIKRNLALDMAISALSCSEIPNSSDSISRQAAIDALCELYEYQRDIDPTEAADLVRQGIFLAEKKIEKLPSAQPDLSGYSDKLWKSAYERGKAEAEDAGWIPCSKRLPAVPCCRCLITRDNGRGETTVEEALFSFGKWYDNEWLEDGRNRKFDISTSVIAWAPFPAPYRGGEK